MTNEESTSRGAWIIWSMFGIVMIVLGVTLARHDPAYVAWVGGLFVLVSAAFLIDKLVRRKKQSRDN
jgi:hypothetical protein